MAFGLVDRLVGKPVTRADADARRVGMALIWALLIGSLLAAWCIPRHWAEALLWGGCTSCWLHAAGVLIWNPADSGMVWGSGE